MDHWGMYERLLHHAGKALQHAETFGGEAAARELRQVVTPDGKYVPERREIVPSPDLTASEITVTYPAGTHTFTRRGDDEWLLSLTGPVENMPNVSGYDGVNVLEVLEAFLGVPPDQAPVTADSRPEKCPRCGSPDPRRHPATQFEGEVQPCPDSWHGPPAYREGDTWVLGPGVISTTEAPQADTVLNWRGENFTVQSELQAARERLEAIFEASHERGDAELFNVVRHTEAQVRREGK